MTWGSDPFRPVLPGRSRRNGGGQRKLGEPADSLADLEFFRSREVQRKSDAKSGGRSQSAAIVTAWKISRPWARGGHKATTRTPAGSGRTASPGGCCARAL